MKEEIRKKILYFPSPVSTASHWYHRYPRERWLTYRGREAYRESTDINYKNDNIIIEIIFNQLKHHPFQKEQNHNDKINFQMNVFGRGSQGGGRDEGGKGEEGREVDTVQRHLATKYIFSKSKLKHDL